MYKIAVMDGAMIALYFVVVLYIGFHFKEKISGTTDYYLANRSLGFLVIMATVSASIIGGASLIGRGGIVYSDGVVGILLAVPYLIGMYVFSLISGRIQSVGKKFNIGSIPDLMRFRFGPKIALMTAALVAFTMMATVGSQITATATILKTLGGISYEAGAWIGVSVFVTYTFFSGLYGVVYTDVVQFLVLIVFVYMILPFICVSKVGGVTQLFHSIPDHMLQFNISPKIIGWIFTNLLFTLAGAEMWQRAFAAKSPQDAKKGMLLGNTIYGFTIIISVFISLCAVVLLPDIIEKYGTADAAVPAMVIHYLPVGITGITIAALMAVLMSTADTYLLISVQTIVSDIIKPLSKNLNDKKELFLSRIFTILLGFGALIIALYIRQAYAALMFSWTFYAASLGFPALAALYWKKATKIGVAAGIIAGFVGSTCWRLIGSPLHLSPSIAGSVACGIVILAVSLITYKEETRTPFPEI